VYQVGINKGTYQLSFVCLSVHMYQPRSHWADFLEIGIGDIIENLSKDRNFIENWQKYQELYMNT